MTINLCDDPNWIRFSRNAGVTAGGFDLLFTAAGPRQVEDLCGELKSVALIRRSDKLTPYQIETIAQNIIGDNLWLIEDLHAAMFL